MKTRKQVMIAPWRSAFHRAFPSIALFLILVVTLVVLLSNSAWSQGETTSAIQGQATDATGAAVSGATVTLASQETGLKRRSSRTNQEDSIFRN